MYTCGVIACPLLHQHASTLLAWNPVQGAGLWCIHACHAGVYATGRHRLGDVCTLQAGMHTPSWDTLVSPASVDSPSSARRSREAHLRQTFLLVWLIDCYNASVKGWFLCDHLCRPSQADWSASAGCELFTNQSAIVCAGGKVCFEDCSISLAGPTFFVAWWSHTSKLATMSKRGITCTGG